MSAARYNVSSPSMLGLPPLEDSLLATALRKRESPPYFNELPVRSQGTIQKRRKNTTYTHFKKRLAAFSSPAGMSLTKLPLGRE
jgi:hypothetical protein